MNSGRWIPLVAAALVGALSGGLACQTLGQFGGAGSAPDGEGAVFLLAGDDAVRAGLSVRFNITSVSDLGIQLGVDRTCGTSFYGGGVDLKIVLLEGAGRFPVDLALDAAVGALDGTSANRFVFDFGILASCPITLSSGRAFEPFLSFVVDVEQIDRKNDPPLAPGCLCAHEADETSSCAGGRGGVILPLTKESQIVVEAHLDGDRLVGAAFNLVF